MPPDRVYAAGWGFDERLVAVFPELFVLQDKVYQSTLGFRFVVTPHHFIFKDIAGYRAYRRWSVQAMLDLQVLIPLHQAHEEGKEGIPRNRLRDLSRLSQSRMKLTLTGLQDQNRIRLVPDSALTTSKRNPVFRITLKGISEINTRRTHGSLDFLNEPLYPRKEHTHDRTGIHVAAQ